MRTFTDASAKSSGAMCLAVSPDGRLLGVGSSDKRVRIYDTANMELVQTFDGHENSVYSLAFSPDSKHLSSGSLDRSIVVWDVAAGKAQATLKKHTVSSFFSLLIHLTFI